MTSAMRLLSCPDAAEVRGLVATGGELVVCSLLIGVGRPLIDPARGLVVFRPCLILIARYRLAIDRRLFVRTGLFIPTARGTITTFGRQVAGFRRLVALARPSVALGGLGFRSTGRARRSSRDLAASRTPHDLRHRPTPPHRAAASKL
ncbi:MAG TPA: hypothetical protein VEY87_01090 [Gaiellaceae bacterium]|nr:hypothetical protein [Gaiellaceae bacterium]